MPDTLSNIDCDDRRLIRGRSGLGAAARIVREAGPVMLRIAQTELRIVNELRIDVQLRIDDELAIYDEVGTHENWGFTLQLGNQPHIIYGLQIDCKLS